MAPAAGRLRRLARAADAAAQAGRARLAAALAEIRAHRARAGDLLAEAEAACDVASGFELARLAGWREALRARAAAEARAADAAEARAGDLRAALSRAEARGRAVERLLAAALAEARARAERRAEMPPRPPVAGAHAPVPDQAPPWPSSSLSRPSSSGASGDGIA